MRYPITEVFLSSLWEIAQLESFGKSTLCEISKCFQKSDEASLEKILSHCAYKKGASSVSTPEGETMINTKSVQFKDMCGFYLITTQDMKISFWMTDLFPVNWKYASRSKTTHSSIDIKYSPQHLYNCAAGSIPSMVSIQIRLSDQNTANEVRNMLRR